ncbi:hypothetical protein BDZ91DRAFT_230142 [Kalaharituber pfeilii]|nr:hypothetical protein BDZ91DRAFT_230142 [Kalaharituber pfeilii]
MPIQFTSQSHASFKSHFKTVVQYILNLILNPAFPRDDEYFQFALKAVDRRVDGYRDSVLKSEAWKSDFMLALKNRPGFEYDKGVSGVRDHCRACNTRDRHASFTVRFMGPRYDPETLEDYSDEEDGDEESQDEMGNVIPPSGKSFPVGRYCYQRAEITHGFWHWKKGLRTALEDVLRKMGVFKTRITKRVEKMGYEERWRWATGELEKLEKGGDVDLLWDMFEAQMKNAEECVVSTILVLFHLLFRMPVDVCADEEHGGRAAKNSRGGDKRRDISLMFLCGRS